MSIATGKDIGMGKLLSLWLAKLDMQYRRFQNKRQIVETERYLMLIAREIAERNEARQQLQHELMVLKAERNSL